MEPLLTNDGFKIWKLFNGCDNWSLSCCQNTPTHTFHRSNLFPFDGFLDPPVPPLLHGHVLDDVTAMAAAKDQEAGHEEAPDVEAGPRAIVQAVQEVVRHVVQVILEWKCKGHFKTDKD